MNRVFDTAFEMSLRLILFLSENGCAKETTRTGYTFDMLALIDTIAIYGAEFGIAEFNLHGRIDTVLDEFDTRRELIKTALKDLVLRGLIDIMESGEGFRYTITPNGVEFAMKLTSDYAAQYRELAKAANKLTAQKSEHEIFALISDVCTATIKRRSGNV